MGGIKRKVAELFGEALKATFPVYMHSINQEFETPHRSSCCEQQAAIFHNWTIHRKVVLHCRILLPLLTPSVIVRLSFLIWIYIWIVNQKKMHTSQYSNMEKSELASTLYIQSFSHVHVPVNPFQKFYIRNIISTLTVKVNSWLFRMSKFLYIFNLCDCV